MSNKELLKAKEESKSRKEAVKDGLFIAISCLVGGVIGDAWYHFIGNVGSIITLAVVVIGVYIWTRQPLMSYFTEDDNENK
ncbi:hypothetical protein N9137_00900 [Pseudomonadales bacterium]|nr:hypothetical protein [Pseudomonadales bacterium]